MSPSAFLGRKEKDGFFVVALITLVLNFFK